MSTVVVEADVRQARWGRWAAVAGLAFAALFVVALLVGRGTPSYDARDIEWVNWFDDRANRTAQVASMFLMAASALAFVVFATGLTRRVRRLAHRDDLLPSVALSAGCVFAALLLVGGVVVNSISAATAFTPDDFAIPKADVLRSLDQLGFGLLLVGGGWAAALFVSSASLAARGAAGVPAWFVFGGIAAGVLLLASALFIPVFVLPLWVIVVSIDMLRRPLLEVDATVAVTG